MFMPTTVTPTTRGATTVVEFGVLANGKSDTVL